MLHNLCTGEMCRVQSELEQQVSQGLQERQGLELKLAQAERNAQRSLATAQHTHQEQLEAERKDKVQPIYCTVHTLKICPIKSGIKSHM